MFEDTLGTAVDCTVLLITDSVVVVVGVGVGIVGIVVGGVVVVVVVGVVVVVVSGDGELSIVDSVGSTVTSVTVERVSLLDTPIKYVVTFLFSPLTSIFLSLKL